jgi:hypothetical protein
MISIIIVLVLLAATAMALKIAVLKDGFSVIIPQIS